MSEEIQYATIDTTSPWGVSGNFSNNSFTFGVVSDKIATFSTGANLVVSGKIICDDIEVKNQQPRGVSVVITLDPGCAIQIPVIGRGTICILAKPLQPAPETHNNFNIDYSFGLVLIAGFFLSRFLNWVYRTYKRGEVISNFGYDEDWKIHIPMPPVKPRPDLPKGFDE